MKMTTILSHKIQTQKLIEWRYTDQSFTEKRCYG